MKTRAAIALLFVGLVAIALARGAPDVIDRPLLLGQSGSPPVPLPVPFASTDGDQSLREIALQVRSPAELERHDQIDLFLGSFDTTPTLIYGWLQVAGSDCAFKTPAQRLKQNARVVFTRAGLCNHRSTASGRATLRLVLAGPARYARAAVWTSAPAEDAPANLTTEAFGRVLGLVGRTIDRRPGPSVSRIDLLAFMWEVQAKSLALILTIAGTLAVIGAALVVNGCARRGALAAFGLACGLALFYAVIVPPLEAPDEPDHLLSFAQLTRKPALAEAESLWAKRIHFYRLTMMPDERFTPADREKPFDLDWPSASVHAEDVWHRSSTATQLWRAISPMAPASPAHAVLLFRIVNAVIFGVAFAVATVLLTLGRATVVPALLTVLLLILPTLPFFGMQLSEVPFTVAGFVLAGYGAVMLGQQVDGRITGPLLGIAVTLLACGPRSGWPSLVTVAALAVGRIFGSDAERGRPARDTAWFWGGLGAPAVLLLGTRLLWIPSPAYDRWYLSTFDPRAGISSMSFLLGLVAALAVGAMAERLLTRVSAVSRALGQAARGICAVSAMGIATTLMWSAWAPLPMLQNIEHVDPGPPGRYVWSVMMPLLTAARIQGFDFFTWTLLWGGFGWADALLPPSAIGLATIVAAGAAIVTLLTLARDKNGQAALLMVCGVAGLATSAATTAITSYGLHRNVHGRYLLGVCVIGLCLLAGPTVLARGRRIPLGARAIALLAVAFGLHAFALSFLLEKYFG